MLLERGEIALPPDQDGHEACPEDRKLMGAI
jgi:hypothetical protein